MRRQKSSEDSAAGSSSSTLAHHTYNVGKRNTPMTRLASRPPTMTMANGRWESEPMAWERAAGSRPRVATSIVIMIGRSLNTAPSTAASRMRCSLDSSMPRRRERSWLMYSSMITPVWTETPNKARKPTAEETEKLVWERKSANGPPMEARMTETRMSTAHLTDRNMV